MVALETKFLNVHSK